MDAIEEHPSEMLHGLPAWQLLGFRAANPASSLGDAGVLPLLMLLLCLDYASHLAARLLHLATAGALLPAHAQQAAERLPPFSLADVAVEVTRWTLHTLASGGLNLQAQRLGSATIAAGWPGSSGCRGVWPLQLTERPSPAAVGLLFGLALPHIQQLRIPTMPAHCQPPTTVQSCSGWVPPPSLSSAGRRPSSMPTRSACCCRCWCRRSRRRAAMCGALSSGTCGGRRKHDRAAPAPGWRPVAAVFVQRIPPF